MYLLIHTQVYFFIYPSINEFIQLSLITFIIRYIHPFIHSSVQARSQLKASRSLPDIVDEQDNSFSGVSSDQDHQVGGRPLTLNLFLILWTSRTTHSPGSPVIRTIGLVDVLSLFISFFSFYISLNLFL